MSELQNWWSGPLTSLSCEIEGHPLGGGLLKVEPREASRILLSKSIGRRLEEREVLAEAVSTLRSWRHHGNRG
jgi:hypothetical protein